MSVLNIAAATRIHRVFSRKGKGLLTTHIVSAMQVVTPRIVAQRGAFLGLNEDTSMHLKWPHSFFTQLLHASFVDDINVFHWHVVGILKPKGAPRRDEEHLRVPDDFHVVLLTPVVGFREAGSDCSAISRVFARLNLDE